MSADDVQPRRYQVTAPMVVAKSGTPDGIRLSNFYKHTILPPDVPERQIALFLRRKLIVQIDENGRPVVPEPVTPAVSAAAAAAKAGGRPGAKTG